LRCILAGQDGVVWVGTGDSGLIQLRPRPFNSILTTNSLGEKIEVFSICTGLHDRLWFGTSEGLFRLQDGLLSKFTNTCLNPGMQLEHSVRAVLEDRAGTVWFGVKNEGLKVLHDSQFTSVPDAACGCSNSWTASSLLEDSAGQLWIGSEAGLVCRSTDGRFTPELRLPNIRITGIQQAHDGAIWVGTEGAGAYRLAGKDRVQFTKQTGLSSDFVSPLLAENSGAVWLSTPTGLNRLGPHNPQLVTTRHGLPDSALYSLVEDPNGFYWASCNRGVFRIPKNQLNAVAGGSANWVNAVCFAEADGLASTECNGECQPNATITADARLWFSTTRGCSTIDSRNVVSTEVPAAVVVEEVLVDDQLTFKDGAFTREATNFTQGVLARFPAGRGRVVEIRYTANSFLNPKRVSFAYQLKGHDTSWRDAGPRRVAFYTNLKPGRYNFEVKARNEHGAWSPQVAAFAFSVAPHFWQTSQFYIGSGLIIIVLAVAVQRYRLRWQHRLLKLEEQRALANERSRIARDLHDDLGTALTGLALELDLVGRDTSDKPSLAVRLCQTAQRTRDLAERMREVVWTVNPRCDTVSSFADFLEAQVEQFLSARDIRIKLDFPEDIPPIPLDAKARHHLALSVREALNNVIRHADAKEVTVSLELTVQILAVRVRDNGTGFLPAEESGHGLANLRARMEEIGGTLQCISAPGEGTIISFELPLTRGQPRREVK
jgi:signal transduction histidine kinase